MSTARVTVNVSPGRMTIPPCGARIVSLIGCSRCAPAAFNATMAKANTGQLRIGGAQSERAAIQLFLHPVDERIDGNRLRLLLLAGAAHVDRHGPLLHLLRADDEHV